MKPVLKIEEPLKVIYKIVNEFLAKIRAQNYKPAHTLAQEASLDVAVLLYSQVMFLLEQY